jgi:type II secretory pathway pseudopilin PulG
LEQRALRPPGVAAIPLIEVHVVGWQTSGSRSGLTLVEVVLALTILGGALLAAGVALATSVRSAKQAQRHQVARHAAGTLVERLRSRSLTTAYDRLWRDPALTTATIDGARWVTGGDADGLLSDAVNEVLAPATARGLLSDGTLALRFLDEATFNARFGASLDLDFDGSKATALPAPAAGAPRPAYRMHPVLVLVRWRDEGGPGSHTLLATLTDEAPLDAGRR